MIDLDELVKKINDQVEDGNISFTMTSMELLHILNRAIAAESELETLRAQLKHVHGDFAYCQELNAGLLIERDLLKAKLTEANEINLQLSAVTADVQVLQDRLTVCAAEREQYRVKLAEIEKQEPVGEFNGVFGFSGRSYFEVTCFDALPMVGAKLYASPVKQFKQSCAECGAGADDEGLCLYCVKCMFSAQQSPSAKEK